MSRISVKETNRNYIMEYTLDLYNGGDLFDWLIYAANCDILHVRRIQLDNTLDRSDEDNNSVILGKIVSKEKVIDLCKTNGVEIVSIVATYEQKPVIIGIDLRTNKPFITVRKKQLADYKQLEKELYLC